MREIIEIILNKEVIFFFFCFISLIVCVVKGVGVLNSVGCVIGIIWIRWLL